VIDQPLIKTGRVRGLTIQRSYITETGPFTGGGWKLIWHTTEGGNMSSVLHTLRQKGAEVHFVIAPEIGLVEQMVRLNQYGKGLMHPAGTPETNRANCIQVEIIGFAKDSPHWGEHIYRNLARLALLIEHRVAIPRRVGRPFGTNVQRVTPAGFPRSAGHFGHEHVPNNDHVDPGAMRAKHLLNLMERV